jgi:hypothetical protein
MNASVKKIFETSLRSLVALSILTAFAVASARAQNREEHFISARAGGVNFVNGDVRTRREGEADWQRLKTNDDLKSGDAVRTGLDGRVEVLLNPGSYFRAGESTEFELVDASLDNLRLRLARGSAVIEAVGYDKLGLDIAVATPQARVHIVLSGVYRFNVLSGVTEVAVQKGRAVIGEGAAAQVVKGGYVARVGAGGVEEVAKLDKNGRDALDLWSRERGRELAKENEKLNNRQNRTLLASNSFNYLFSAQYSGVWFFSRRVGCYTFLPFGYGWSSPYGVGYDSWLFLPATYCGSCGLGGYRPIVNNTNPTGNNGSGGNPRNTGSNPGSNTYPGNFGGSPRGGGSPSPPPSTGQPVREIPSRNDVDRPMPERSREPSSRP